MANSDLIVVDARTRCNRNPFFFPLQCNLQGEIRVTEYRSDKAPGHLAQLPGGVLPGERMTFNARTGEYRVEHKLDMPEHKDIADAVRRHAARFDDLRQKQWSRFGELQEGRVDKEEIPTWLWWIARMVDARKLDLVSGDLPSLEKIRAMGDVRITDGTMFGDSESAKKLHTLSKLEPETAGSKH